MTRLQRVLKDSPKRVTRREHCKNITTALSKRTKCAISYQTVATLAVLSQNGTVLSVFTPLLSFWITTPAVQAVCTKVASESVVVNSDVDETIIALLTHTDNIYFTSITYHYSCSPYSVLHRRVSRQAPMLSWLTDCTNWPNISPLVLLRVPAPVSYPV